MLPPSLPQDMYATFFENLKPESKPKVIVDAPADQLKYVLKYHPFLIKPNLKELSDYLNLELTDASAVLEACHMLQSEGARNILVSLGKHGAIFMDEKQNSYRIPAPGGEMIDKTGAGDSMIAGFLSDYLNTNSLESAAYMAVATGSATEGARNILVSLGKHGAIFMDEKQNSYRIPAPGGEMIDKTGAGDSMIAGFLSDYLNTNSLESAAYMAVATGSATATTDGIATKETVQKLRAQMSDHSDWGEALV